MKLILLGDDRDCRRLAAAAVAEGHDVAPLPAETLAAAGALPTDAARRQWDELVSGDQSTGVIVGRSADQDGALRALQELARLGRPILTTFPLFTSVLSYFEVDMVRTESGTLIQHFNPLAQHPALDEAALWAAHGHPQLGRVEQVVCTRRLRDRSQESVLWHFARDIEPIQVVAGRINRLGAHAGASSASPDYSALSVQLLGPAELPVRWTIEPPAADEGLLIGLVCTEGRAELSFDLAGELTGAAVAGVEAPTPPHDASRQALRRFVAAIDGSSSASSTWPAALHAMELTDSIEISLRRGRMIDVHNQQLTEQLAFRGTMAAAGCGVLLVLVPLLLALGWLAGQFDVPVARYWPHLLLGLLVVFLGFQLLPRLLSPAAPPEGDHSAAAEPRPPDKPGR